MRSFWNKDETPYNWWRSGIQSIWDRQDVLLYDYLYLLKKVSFVMIVLGFVYSVNLAANISGGYLSIEDSLFGFEKTTLSNILGLYPMTRFELEKDDCMNNVDDLRLTTLIIDFVWSLIFIGIITLRTKWRIYPSDYAVKLINISKDINKNYETDIHKLFEEKIGKIHEITTIRETGEILNYQLKLLKITEKIGDIKAKDQILGKNESK